MIDLEPIKAREAAATKGPWIAENLETREDGTDGCAWGVSSDEGIVVMHDFVGQIDAVFIASARTDVPALIAEIERLRSLAATE